MAAPNEIIIGPAEVYVAPVGASFPPLDVTPGAPWVLVGTLGSKNYAESGVLLRRTLTMNYVRTLGSTVARKAAISETSFEVEFNVLDLSPDFLALAYGVDPADISEAGDRQEFDLNVSPVPLTRAVLVRVDQSALADGAHTQWEIFQAVQAGQGEGHFSKTEGFGAGHLWVAIESTEGFARYVVGEASS